MPRVKLRVQDAYNFKTEVEVTGDDVNEVGHLSFERVLSIGRRTWQALFAELGVRDSDLGDGVTGVIVSDVVVNYRGEAFAGERLVVDVCPFEVGSSTFRLAMRLEVAGSGRLVALMELGMTAFDYQARARSQWPSPVETRLRELAD